MDCIIVGGGPAGLTAATYLRRFHRSVLVFDDGRSRARWIPKTHNCPGFPHGVSGAELLQRLRQQASEYGVRFESSTVTHVQRDPAGWHVSDGPQVWSARALILATGVEDRMPIAADQCASAIAQGVLRLCAICDGYEATDKAIVVIGPLHDALSHACFLRTFSARVKVAPTDDGARIASPALDELMRKARALEIGLLPTLRSVSFEQTHCRLTDQTGTSHVFDTAYVAMGSPGRLSLAEQAGAQIRKDEIITDAHMRTTVDGVYAIGDVVTDLNQISVAFGHASIAATAVHRALPPAPRS